MTFCSMLLAMVVGISETCSTSGVVRVGGEYAESVRRAGDVPVVICRTAKDEDLDKVLSSVDLLLLPGGEDVDPARYGEKPTPGMGPVNAVRDDFEFRLLKAAVRRELPVVGICRGCQVVNVFFGGTLYQDLPTDRPSGTVVHRDRSSKKATQALRHGIVVEEGTRLAAAIGTNRALRVNSIHHQAVKDVAPGFRVTARAADGVAEAIESDRYPAAGVQFHPEKLVANHSDPVWELFFRNLKAFALPAGSEPVHVQK